MTSEQQSYTPDPQFLGTPSLSTLCSTMPRPLLMTGFFRDMLMQGFADADHIEQPDLKRLIWRQDETTNILIEAIHRWRPELTEHRPGVIIKRNAYTSQRMGIADRLQASAADKRGDPHFETFWVGSHTLFCIGGSGSQADLLGAEVQRRITGFSEVIRSSLMLHRFLVTEIGAVSELEEATENFVVPVTVGYAYSERWKNLQQAPRLNTISLSSLLDQ
jgi:hypothetical protein